jgi:glycine oxidase
MQALVVGGGLMGLAVGELLAASGWRVVVLEKAVLGAEASSAAAGILSPRMEAHGREPLRSLGVESLKMYPEWVKKLEKASGLGCGLWQRGLIRVVAEGEDPESLKPDVEAIWQEQLPEVLKGVGGWWLPEEASIEPVRLLAALKLAAVQAGCSFITGVPVEEVSAEGVLLGDGRRLKGVPVVCAGAWTRQILQSVPVRPVRGQVLELQGKPDVEAVAFGGGGYLVPRPDGRVLVGATMEEAGFERAVTPEGLSRLIEVVREVRPGLLTVPFLRGWSNFRPATPDESPVIGWKEGVFVASGHYRNGILLAPLTARVVVDALISGKPVPKEWDTERFL